MLSSCKVNVPLSEGRTVTSAVGCIRAMSSLLVHDDSVLKIREPSTNVANPNRFIVYEVQLLFYIVKSEIFQEIV